MPPLRKRPFRPDLLALPVMVLGALALGAHGWLRENPQHNPWAPLALDDPPGWATPHKIAALRGATEECRRVLEEGAVRFATLEPVGELACRREDRQQVQGTLLSPQRPQMTCPVLAGFEIWLRHGVQPLARDLLGSEVARIEHLGTYNCRRIGGGDSGDWSEHATGNALDIAAFVLEDGRRISVLDDWQGHDADAESRFLRAVRGSACDSFATVLSPDYNAAHADHLHLDQANRLVGSVCR